MKLLLRLAPLWTFCMAACLTASMQALAQTPATDPYRELAESLAKQITAPSVNVGVGSFVYEDSEFMSPFSSMLREELERALAQTGKFKVITRDRLADLQKEGKFQAASILEPGAAAPAVKIEGVKGMVRGRFYYKDPEVTIYAELAWLEGGAIQKAKVILPTSTVGAQIWPNNMPPQKRIEEVFRPQNLDKSLANVKDIENRVAKVPHDFNIALTVREAKRDFCAGETISYRIASPVGCHVAVFCHQLDGSTVVLFPNPFSKNTWVPADRPVDIPGPAKSGFEIVVGPPFGGDVVQIIACTQASALHRKLASYNDAHTAPGKRAYRGLSRGMFAQGVDDSLAEFAGANSSDASGPPRWSEAHIVVNTYPKLR